MIKYYICFCTGAGNFFAKGNDLTSAKKEADENAAYTQQSIVIYEVVDGVKNHVPVTSRQWYSVPFDSSLYDSKNPNVIKFGNFGYYDVWSDELVR